MKILRNLIIFFCLIVTSKMLNAQDGAASFSVPYQYGNVPVNLSTGAPSVSIPFCTASSGSLAIPISANYNTNGLRSSDIPTEIGLHWNLNAGGSIVQIVRSKNNLGIAENQDDILNPSNLFMGQVNEGLVDAEPDIYKVNAPGLNVDFMLSEDNKFVKLTENNVKIEYISNDNWRFGFIITSEEGVKYYFNNRKTSTYKEGEGIDAKYTFTYVWLLGRIENSDNTHFIIFNYTDATDFGDGYTFCYGSNYTGTSSFNGDISENYAVTFTSLEFIKSIETENETVYFNYFTPSNYTSPYSEYENDEPPVDKTLTPPVNYYNRTEVFLENILIKNKNNELIKSYNLNYYVNSNNRVFLNQVQEKDKNGLSLPAYSFEYYDIENTGEVFNKDYDYWGYYNPGVNGQFPEGNVPISMIKKVYYPTGGYTEYFYEPNTYCFDMDTESPWYNEDWKNILFNNGFSSLYGLKNLRGGGYRIYKIEVHTDNTVSKKIFDYSNDIIIDSEYFPVSSGRLTSYPIHSFSYYYYSEDGSDSILVSTSSNNHLGIEQGYIAYEKISVYEEGKVYKEDDEDKSFSHENGLSHFYGENGKTIYTYKQPIPFIYQSSFPYQITTYPQNELSLLKGKIVFDSDNYRKSKENVNYSIVENETEKRYGLRVIERSSNSFYTGNYSIIPKSIKLNNTTNATYATNQSIESIESNVQYSYTRNDEERKYPTKITKTESNGDVIETFMYYPKDFAGSSELDPNGVYAEMIARNIHSPVLKTEVYKNNELISGEKTNFDFFVTSDNKSLIVAKTSEVWEDGAYKTVKWFDKYTNKGNLLESHGIDNIYSSVIYNTEETEVIASIINANKTEVFHDDFEELTENFSTNSYTGKYSKHIFGTESSSAFAGVNDFEVSELISNKYTYSAWFNTNTEGVKLVLKEWNKSPWQSYTVPNTNGEWKYFEFTVDVSSFTGNQLRCEIWANGNDALVDQVRFNPADAYMNTATYLPLTGKTSETNANSISIFYEYDSFGRLIKAFNQDNELIKEYEYHIKQ